MSDDVRVPILRDLLTTSKDGDWGRKTPHQGFVPYYVIRGTDFPNVRIGDTSTVPVRYLNESTSARRTLTPGDILIETAGGSAGRPTGRTILITERLLSSLDHPATCASFARFLRIDPCKAFPPYVYWHLQHLYASGQMEEHQVQHTGIARFQYTKFAESVTIPLPNSKAQCAIADILGTLDDKIELNRKRNETLGAMAKALFKSWFVDFDPVRAKSEGRDTGLPSHISGLFPDSFVDSELGEMPKGWQIKQIGELADIVGGTTPSSKDPSFWDGGSNAWATPKDLSGLSAPVLLSTERLITGAGLSQIGSGLLPKGTVLLSSRAPIGYLAIAELPVAINQGFIAMKAKKGTSNLFLLLWASNSLDVIKSRANGSTFLEISKTNFRPILVASPSSVLMNAFEQVGRPLYKRIVESVRESDLLATFRDTLLPKLISGEITL